MSYVLQIAPDDDRLGGKARSLAALAQAGLPTPTGFVLSDALFRRLCPGIAGLPRFERIDEPALDLLDRLSKALMSEAWPAGFEGELEDALRRLPGKRYAVRSSFVGEDVASELAAGVYHSEVGVALPDVLPAVRRVLGSAVAAGAVAYAVAHGTQPARPPVAVLIHTFHEGDADGSAACDPGASRGPLVTVRRGSISAAASAEIGHSVTALAAARGPTEIEWVVEGGRILYLQMRPYRPAPDPVPWSGWADLDEEEREAWRWDAAHNPLPLSPAQAGIVAHVDGRCRIGIRQRVLGGYLFFRADDRGAVDGIPCEQAAPFFRTLQLTVESALARLGTNPNLEETLELFCFLYEPLFGALQPALRRARRRLAEFLEAASFPAQYIPRLEAGVPSVATERIRLGHGLHDPSQAHRAAARNAYLTRFGDEAPAWDVAVPTYAEDFSVLDRPDGETLVSVERNQQPGSRSSGWQEASAAVEAGLPSGLVPAWRGMLRVFRTAVALGEADDWLYAKAQAAIRRAMLSVGQSQTDRGWLAGPSDVFFLPFSLVRQLAEGRQGDRSLRDLVVRARAQWERDRANPPPSQGLDSGRLIRGVGTGGRVIGRAVLHHAGRRASSSRGQVLVSETLLPTELPLIAPAGIVVETGGALDHVAAQARERAIPAVVGAKGARAAIADGDMLLVDADAGLVVRLG